MHFRYGFKELIDGKHPNKEGWVVNRNVSITGQVVRALPAMGGFTEKEQEILSQLVLEVSLDEIRAVSKSPDWLGYLGLVLVYCDSKKEQLSEVWAPQFLSMLPSTSRAYSLMTEVLDRHRGINLNDLEIIESAI